ncbi:MAG: hypothetical protein AAB560_02210 [Patescibacteria group bacterium]
MPIYFMPKGGRSLRDLAAANDLLREEYPVVKTGLSPSLASGLLIEVGREVAPEDQDVLGIMEWV